MKRIALLLILSSCIKTEVINAPMLRIDTTQYKARRELPQHEEDTTRIPITFNPSVEDWEQEQDINI